MQWGGGARACLLLGDALGTLPRGFLVQWQPQAVHCACLASLQLQPDVFEFRDAALTARLLLLTWGIGPACTPPGHGWPPTSPPPAAYTYPAPGSAAAAGSGGCRSHTRARPAAGPQAQSRRRPDCPAERPGSAAPGCGGPGAAPQASACGTVGGRVGRQAGRGECGRGETHTPPAQSAQRGHCTVTRDEGVSTAVERPHTPPAWSAQRGHCTMTRDQGMSTAMERPHNPQP